MPMAWDTHVCTCNLACWVPWTEETADYQFCLWQLMLKLPQCWAQVKPVGRQHDRPRAFPRDSDSFSQQQSRCCFDHFLQPPHLPSHQSSPLRKLALLLIGLLGCFYWINDIFAYFFFFYSQNTHSVWQHKWRVIKAVPAASKYKHSWR